MYFELSLKSYVAMQFHEIMRVLFRKILYYVVLVTNHILFRLLRIEISYRLG